MVYPETFEGFAVHDSKNWQKLEKIEYKPKPFGEYDIDIKIEACGVCGSDVHTVSGGWGDAPLPLVVGHEIVGKAIKVGDKVSTVKVGDRVGVGAQICSCMECTFCKNNNENYCPQWIDTYGAKYPDGTLAHGGYASHIRAHEYYTFKIPEAIETSLAAPMLCAGITSYSPLVRNGAGPGKKVGIVGIGGIGHFGVMFSKALGAHTVAISRTDAKKEDAFKLGADEFIRTCDEDWAKPHKMTFDLIVNCANSDTNFDVNAYLSLLTVGGRFINVGLPEGEGYRVKPMTLLTNAALIGSSHIGSRKEILEMLDLAATQGIKSWVETIPISAEGCSQGLTKCHDNKVKYRVTLVDYEKAFGA
ncbi:chaperonin 10-like protein [Dipodascopsis tothii]|uniref:chaperonin 10-like protein n=1 Tax=Dipodascopsis tothii TaxID=44089 RepID=UPI0034CF3F32